MLIPLFFLFSFMSSADVSTDLTEEEKPNFFRRIFSGIEEERMYLSETLLDTSNEVDVFFSNQRYLKTRNATNLMLSNTVSAIEGDGVSNNFDLSLKLKLPRSQNKLQFQFDQQVDELRQG